MTGIATWPLWIRAGIVLCVLVLCWAAAEIWHLKDMQKRSKTLRKSCSTTSVDRMRAQARRSRTTRRMLLDEECVVHHRQYEDD